MFGLDERIAEVSNGASIWIVLAVAVLLGLRHATDPDHLAAVTTLVASGRERAPCRAAELGLAWGFGHAVTLFAFGLPVLLFSDVLPQRVQQVAETAIGFVIVYLALRLLLRWRRGELRFHAHPHAHGARTRRAAFAIGLMHGMAGSAGVGVLVLASVRSTGLAVASLVLLAVFTALSMSLLSRGLGSLLVSRPARGAFGAPRPRWAQQALPSASGTRRRPGASRRTRSRPFEAPMNFRPPPGLHLVRDWCSHRVGSKSAPLAPEAGARPTGSTSASRPSASRPTLRSC